MTLGLRGRAVVLLVVGTVAAFLYSNFLLDAVFSPDHDWLAVVSDLEVPGEPTATLLRVTDVVCAVLTVSLLPWVWQALPGRRVAPPSGVADRGVRSGSVLAALVPLPCAAPEVCTGAADEMQRWWHDGFSVVSATALFLGAGCVALDTRRHGPAWMHRAAQLTFWVGGVVGTVVFIALGTWDPDAWQTGLAQRLQILAMSGWIFCLALYAATAPAKTPQ